MLSGARGFFLSGYHVAGALAKWEVLDAPVGDVSTLRCTVVARDPFWGVSTPLDVGLVMGSVMLVWRNIEQTGPGSFTLRGEPASRSPVSEEAYSAWAHSSLQKS